MGALGLFLARVECALLTGHAMPTRAGARLLLVREGEARLRKTVPRGGFESSVDFRSANVGGSAVGGHVPPDPSALIARVRHR